MLKMIMLGHEIFKVVNIIFWSSTHRITGCEALWINLGYRMKVGASPKKTDACLSDYTPSDLTQVSLNNDDVWQFNVECDLLWRHDIPHFQNIYWYDMEEKYM